MRKLVTLVILAVSGTLLTSCAPDTEPREWGQSEQARANNKCLAYYEDEHGAAGAIEQCAAQLATDLDTYMGRWLLYGAEE